MPYLVPKNLFFAEYSSPEEVIHRHNCQDRYRCHRSRCLYSMLPCMPAVSTDPTPAWSSPLYASSLTSQRPPRASALLPPQEYRQQFYASSQRTCGLFLDFRHDIIRDERRRTRSMRRGIKLLTVLLRRKKRRRTRRSLRSQRRCVQR